MNSNDEREIVDFRLYVEISSFLAYKHFNLRSGDVLPNLPQRLQDCDFHITLNQCDSRYSPIYASKQMHDAITSGNGRKHNNPKKRKRSSGERIPMIPIKNKTSIKVDMTIPQYAIGTMRNSSYVSSIITAEMTEPYGTNDDDTGEASEPSQPSESSSNTNNKSPFAVLGSFRSAVTQPMSILAEPFQVPVMSAASTSADLDGQPFFARTVPTDAGDAIAMAIHLNQLGVTHVGILYQHDPWGVTFHADLVREFAKRAIQVVSTNYPEINMEKSVQHLALSGHKHFIGILNPGAWQQIVRFSIKYGIIGQPGYTWIFTEGNADFLSPSFSLDRQTDADLARAIHGSGLVSLELPRHEGFDKALQDFANNEELQKEFFALHRELAK